MHGIVPQRATRMGSYNNIHRQQLFHWVGSHICSEPGSGLSDTQRQRYLGCLRGALRNGLWVKTPRVPDYLGDGSLIMVHRPITCFTEWTLGQSLPHTTRYGRLGFGFPKKFVLLRGGQPVTYVRDSNKNDPYTRSLKFIARFFQFDKVLAKIPPAKLEELRERFDYLSHFNKKIRRPAPLKVAVQRRRLLAFPKRTPIKTADPFERSFGRTLHYLEEREWRIVYSAELETFFEPGLRPGQPEYFLPFKSGAELFTVVLPDNHTVNMAMNDQFIRRKLFPDDAPHVTVLSFQDIGTF